MYHIKITKTEIDNLPRGNKWCVVGKEENGDDKYGYTPPIVLPVEVTVEVLSQSVEELDLPAVIKAVNEL